MDEERTRRLEQVAPQQTPDEPPSHPDDAVRSQPPADNEEAAFSHQFQEGVEASSFEQPVAYVSLGLTVGDGFKFGCGLALALTITALLLVLLAAVIFLVASLMGVPLPLL